MKHYTVKTEFGTYRDITISTARYNYDDSLAIELISDSKGPFARLTVCIDNNIKLKDNESFVDTNNCPWAIEFIEQNKLGEYTGEFGASGYCVYPLYRFNLDTIKN